ncbi:MAG: energy-coupling factor transporter transmembrane component T [Eubacteriales bacterium]
MVKIRHIFNIYHPLVIFIYIAAALIFTMLTLNPCLVLISLVCGSIYSIYLNGSRHFISTLKIAFPMFLIIALFNPLLNHRGLTVLFYLFDNPITKESIIYGVCQAGVISSVFIWFSCYNAIMLNDKFLYLFKKISPTISLMTSMTMRLIPLIKYKATRIFSFSKAVEGGKRNSAKGAVKKTTVLMYDIMEQSIITADSMRCRGFGVKKRTSYSDFRFRTHDYIAVVVLAFLILANAFLFIKLDEGFAFYPKLINISKPILYYLPYIILLVFPLLLEIKESILWKI